MSGPARSRRAAAVWLALLGCHAAAASAQTLSGRVAVEAIAAASATTGTVDDPFVVLDLVGTVNAGHGWTVIARPWARRLPGGDWAFEMYQLQARYVSTTRIPFRLDAGIVTSPLGQSTLELQPHRNPLISAPFYYFTPLPAVDGRFDRLQLLSGGYPLGIVFSTSGARWDARAAVTDGTPARSRSVLSKSAPGPSPQLVLGGGFAPTPAFRIGAGFARGAFGPASALPAHAVESRHASVFNLETEFAIAHTRVSGEWVRTAFGSPLGRAVARGFNVQASQALSPRVFAAARLTRATSPVATVPEEVRRSASSFEAVLGYRLTTELTLRAGYRRERGFKELRPHHSAIMSLVWAERWW